MILPRASILVLTTVAAATLIIAVQARRLSSVTREQAAAVTALHDVARQVQEIVDLRATRQTVESRQRPAQDVIAQVNAVLAEVGIPNQQLKSLTPESEGTAVAIGTAGNARLLQQSLRLVLEDLTPQQIGAFLIQWRTAQQIWTPTRIELSHSRAAGQSNDRDGNRYDATILLAALYVGETTSARTAGPRPPTTAVLALMEERP